MARSFNASFTTEKNKRSGAGPVVLVKFGFATPVYISDRDVTPSGGSAHDGIVSSWGYIDTSIQQQPGRGILGAVEAADMTLEIINSQATPFSDKFTGADPPEGVDVEVSYWFSGTTYAEREVFFQGVVRGQPEYNLRKCRLTLRGYFDKINRVIGADLVVSADDFSSADPDDIGRMRNICIGDLVDVPCRGLVAGVVDTLKADLAAGATSFYLSQGGKADMASGTVVIQVDAEQIQGTYNSTTGQITGATRGYNSTDDVDHDKGAKAAEILTEYVYEIAAHPVKTIDAIYIVDPATGIRSKVDSGDYTAYTGQSGDEKAGYEGTAVVAFSTLPILARQVNIDVEVTTQPGVTGSVTTQPGVTGSVTTQPAFAGSGATFEDYPTGDSSSNATSVSNAYDGNEESRAQLNQNGYIQLDFDGTDRGTISKIEYWAKLQNWQAGSTIAIGGGNNGNDYTITTLTPDTAGAEWFRIADSSADDWADSIRFTTGTGEGVYVHEVYRVVYYTPDITRATDAAIGVSRNVDAAISVSRNVDAAVGLVAGSNSTADTVIGRMVTADVTGYADDGSGTYTGTASALVEQPDHVFKLIWGHADFLGQSLSDLDVEAAASTYFSTNGFAFAQLINKPISADRLLASLALQCRSRFFVSPEGSGKLVFRSLTKTSGHAIAKNEIKKGSFSIRRTDFSDLVNFFVIHFAKDLARPTDGPEDYLSAKEFSDATSISTYGQREYMGRQSVFLFDAVRNSAMVADVGGFLLDYHKDVRKMPAFSVFLDNCEIEPADTIDVTHDLDSLSSFVCEVSKVKFVIGSGRDNRIDRLDVVAVEV